MFKSSRARKWQWTDGKQLFLLQQLTCWVLRLRVNNHQVYQDSSALAREAGTREATRAEAGGGGLQEPPLQHLQLSSHSNSPRRKTGDTILATFEAIKIFCFRVQLHAKEASTKVETISAEQISFDNRVRQFGTPDQIFNYFSSIQLVNKFGKKQMNF